MAASHYVALVFGLLFMMAGLIKLIPLDSAQQSHGLPEMFDQFKQFIEVLPAREQLGIKTPAMYISLIGAAEAVLGAMLAFGRPGPRVAAALPLLGIMIGAFYTLVKIGEPLSHTIPAAVFGTAMIYILLNPGGLSGRAGSKQKYS